MLQNQPLLKNTLFEGINFVGNKNSSALCRLIKFNIIIINIDIFYNQQ